MVAMSINLNGDNAWPDLKNNPNLINVPEATPIAVAVLDGGMASGRPSVAFRIDLPDGKIILFQTSARLYCSLAKTIEAKHPDLFVDH